MSCLFGCHLYNSCGILILPQCACRLFFFSKKERKRKKGREMVYIKWSFVLFCFGLWPMFEIHTSLYYYISISSSHFSTRMYATGLLSDYIGCYVTITTPSLCCNTSGTCHLPGGQWTISPPPPPPLDFIFSQSMQSSLTLNKTGGLSVCLGEASPIFLDISCFSVLNPKVFSLFDF